MTLRVLVVEDDREIRSLMQSSLSVEGFEVQTAVTLSEAEALWRHSPPDVIVLDLGLPDGDGLELVKTVRAPWSLSACSRDSMRFMQASSGFSGNAGIVLRTGCRVRSFFGSFGCFDAGFLQEPLAGDRIFVARAEAPVLQRPVTGL